MSHENVSCCTRCVHSSCSLYEEPCASCLDEWGKDFGKYGEYGPHFLLNPVADMSIVAVNDSPLQ